MKKVKVKFLTSIAVMADPKPPAVLDEKYRRIVDGLNAREKPPSASYVKMVIDENKKADRYGEIANGFTRDTGWKAGDEAFINADLAAKWQDAEICEIIADTGKKAA
jgi:hypothetical protein